MIEALKKTIFSTLFEKEQDREYAFLCDSVDAVDLERRQRMLQRGEAPFQKRMGAWL